jgi:hypothetical protein
MLDDGHRFLYGSLVACALGQKLKGLETIKTIIASGPPCASPDLRRDANQRAASEIFADAFDDSLGMNPRAG